MVAVVDLVETGWDIEPGTVLVRRNLHDRYGGRRQGGIGPSRTTPNVLLFTNPARGRQHGYFDGWGDDGCFYYTGEGQCGDQRLVQGNLAILRHREDGRALHLFHAVPGGVEYIGAFEVDRQRPWHTSEAPETGGGPLRAVIMFRLRPVGPVRHFDAPLPATPALTSRVEYVTVEVRNIEEFEATSVTEPTTTMRREAVLVHAYAEHLRALGHDVCRLRIVPPEDSRPLFTNLYDVTAGELIEAKGTITREAVQMAIGQLLDYKRFVTPTPQLVLVVPSVPRPDLVALCGSVQIAVVWKTGDHWRRA